MSELNEKLKEGFKLLILQYQKQKYREKKAEQHKLIIQRGKFVLTFD